MTASALRAIVCGYERGGTTVLAALLRSHPALDSGFEGGFLLADSPRDFPGLEPYASNASKTYRLDAAALADVCNTDDWFEIYARLANRSPVLKHPGIGVFDKAPRYLEYLDTVLAKVPGVPCVVLARDPLAVLHSWRTRLQMNPRRWFDEQLEAACERYVSYYRGYVRALEAGHGDRILLVHYESLCLHTELEAERIFRHLGLVYEPSLLELGRGGTLHANLHGDRISPSFLANFTEYADARFHGRILRRTAEAKAFHWPEDLAPPPRSAHDLVAPAGP